MEIAEPILAPVEPDVPPRIQAELQAEVLRLCAGHPSEIEEIYRIFPGPITRRRALLKLSDQRIRANLRKEWGKGWTELTVTCAPRIVIMELAFSERRDEVHEAPFAQVEIALGLMGQPEIAPDGGRIRVAPKPVPPRIPANTPAKTESKKR